HQRIALAMIASGMDEEALAVADETVGQLGIMSDIFGLILYDHVAPQKSGIPIKSILDAKLPSGGWALYGDRFDYDVTAMAMTALSKHTDDAEVRSAIEEGIGLLSEAQLDTGDYKSWGVRNPESGCQVIIALCACGVDPLTDSRFIKNGNSLVDGLLIYRQSDGGFAHSAGGKTNANASYQALLALTAIKKRGYVYDFAFPGEDPQEPDESSEEPSNAPEVSQTVSEESFEEPSEEPYDEPPEDSSEPSGDSSEEVSEVSEVTGLSSEEDYSSDVYDEPSDDPEEPEESSISDPEVVSAPEGSDPPAEENNGGGATRKIVVAAIIASAGGIAVALLFAFKKATKTAMISVVLVTVAAVCISLAFDVRTPDEYTASAAVSQDFDYNVQFTLDYGEAQGEHAGTFSVGVVKGDTILDVLRRFAYDKGLAIDMRGSYVRGIGGVYEFDISASSGWMYEVNGDYPMVTAVDYLVSEGDVIVWRYVS
ncbi:MAG: DUF4430 domain-containing protein, partial [Clostridia bacterium]|nr:DUF4430 domain-containing protein [Clostridia bacterium]